MPDTDNLPIETAGVDAQIATDVFQNSGETAHAQIVKIAWGDDETVNRATAGTPLPVQIFGITGTTPTITVTGSVKGLGDFSVVNSMSSPLYVTGGVIAQVYGITGASPVAVTGGVNVLSGVTINGTVTVTGGRVLNQSVDSVLVGGTVARNWNLTATDVVRVLNSTSGSTLPTYIVGAEGNIAGVSGDALKVSIVNTGFSASITFDSVLSVQNVGSSALRVQGTANGTPINVQFLTDPTVKIDPTSPVQIDALPPSSLSNLYYGFNRASQTWQNTNNLEKLLLGAKVGSSNGTNEGVYHTVGQWLAYLWNDIDFIKGAISRLDQTIISSKVSTIPFISTSPSSASSLFVKYNETVKYRLTVGTSSSGIFYQNNSDVYDILLCSTVNLLNMPEFFQPQFDPSTGIVKFTYLRSNPADGWLLNSDIFKPAQDDFPAVYPYYTGVILQKDTSVFLPTYFDHAIFVSKDPITGSTPPTLPSKPALSIIN